MNLVTSQTGWDHIEFCECNYISGSLCLRGPLCQLPSPFPSSPGLSGDLRAGEVLAAAASVGEEEEDEEEVAIDEDLFAAEAEAEDVVVDESLFDVENLGDLKIDEDSDAD